MLVSFLATMDTTLALFIYKLVSIGSGLLVCYFGFRLFILGIFTGAGDLSSQFQNTKLILKKAAPGTFFALFGAAVIGMSLWKGLQFEGGAQPLAPGGRGAGVSIGAPGGRGLSDVTTSATSDKLEATRADARITIFELNTLQTRLPTDFPKNKLVDLQNAIRDSKLALVYSVWSKEWGDYAQFKEWIIDGEQQPMPAGFATEGVELFHHGEKK
jgi:hypothetical protein